MHGYRGELEMRSVVWNSALVGLLLCGCNQQSRLDEVKSTSRSNSAEQIDSTRTMPASSGDVEASSRNSPDNLGGQVEVGGILMTSPSEWESKPHGSSLIAAEFSLPRAEGDDTDARLTISTAGGTVEANIERWKGQFDPQPQTASQEEIDVAEMEVAIVDFTGDFNDQRGPFAPAVKRPGYRMIAAVIPAKGQLHFIKATGPKNTIAMHADAIHKFIRSVKVAN